MTRTKAIWFRIRCKVVHDAEERRRSQRVPKIEDHAPAVSLTQNRILLVEDNPTNRKVIEVLLKKRGYRVSSVENGQQAIDTVLQEDPPDLILMDCHMPIMSGFEATRRIRQWEGENGLVRLPIVALTASAFKDDRDQCLAAGMDDFVTKPVDFVLLPAVIAKWLKES